MGYPHITTDLNLSHQYSFNNAKPNASSSPPSSNCHACPNPTSTLFALTHAHLANSFVADVGSNKGAELSNEQQQPLGSSRWNPTAEQLLALEELYRRGTRTPSAAQIQQIATRLRRFGKIEGKNVFYWFQNHKARERQKRRREVLDTDLPQQSETQTLDNKEPAADENREEQTLELFPLGRSNYNNGINISNNKIIKEDTQVPIRVINTSFTTQNLQFFEFLPLKN
ncbi:hypothetical protein COLO4_13154 [Corchorus olitorius]|uniref:Homeobox domain-containing protein n=1 Tax=Corchorus olitorius TaxID=93759 RepID=A0A1R3JXV2_9ROSI|nr:hypothetical protein COLO4_13154 [Corchorus olitorius]